MEILNRKAKFNYFIIDEIECGIELKGTELKVLEKVQLIWMILMVELKKMKYI